MKFKRTILSGVAVIAITVACVWWYVLQRYTIALDHAITSIPFAQEFEGVFPNSHCFYSYYSGEYGTPTLNMKTPLFGRYVLTMQVRVEFNWLRTRVIHYYSPQFFLVEVSAIILPPPVGTLYGDTHLKFGEIQWKQLVAAKGDFTVLGLKLKTSDRIPGFEEHWK